MALVYFDKLGRHYGVEVYSLACAFFARWLLRWRVFRVGEVHLRLLVNAPFFPHQMELSSRCQTADRGIFDHQIGEVAAVAVIPVRELVKEDVGIPFAYVEGAIFQGDRAVPGATVVTAQVS